MGQSTELRKINRSWWGELMFRANWLVFGIIGAVLLAMIPVLGWFMAFGVICVVLWKTFGFREVLIEGDCPACTKALNIDPKTDVIACPVCGSVLQVGDGRLTKVYINH